MLHFRTTPTTVGHFLTSAGCRAVAHATIGCVVAGWMALSTSFIQTAHADSPWPQFRGPGGDGVVADQSVAAKFSEAEDLVWKTDLPGRGWSSPVIADGKVWVTTAIEIQASASEIKARMRRSGVKEREMKSRSIAKSIELRLMAIDFDSGVIENEIPLELREDPDAIHSLNSYASPTPVIDGDFIYCHFGTYGTFCVHRDSGAIQWNHQVDVAHAVGPGSSPLIVGDHLILILDGCEKQRVVALDKTSGKVRWETARPEMDAPDGDQKKAFCTPIVITDSRGTEQLICMASQFIVSLDPVTGEELWRCRHGRGFSIVPRPVFADDVVYFSTGFGKPELWAVNVTGRGDVTDSHVRWVQEKGMPKKPSPLVADGIVYVVADNGVAVALDASDGDILWMKRLGGNYSASPLLVGDAILFASQEGDVTIIRTGRNFEVMHKTTLSGGIMASPAVVQGSLIWRTKSALLRFAAAKPQT